MLMKYWIEHDNMVISLLRLLRQSTYYRFFCHNFLPFKMRAPKMPRVPTNTTFAVILHPILNPLTCSEAEIALALRRKYCAAYSAQGHHIHNVYPGQKLFKWVPLNIPTLKPSAKVWFYGFILRYSISTS